MQFTAFRITERYVLLVLALGFALVMVLLGTAGLVAIRQSERIRRSVAALARDQLLISQLVNDLQTEENAMTDALHQLAQFGPLDSDHRELFHNLELSDQNLSRLADKARGIIGDDVWLDLESSVKQFTREAHRVLEGGKMAEGSGLHSLFQHHDHVIAVVNDLIRSSSERLASTERQIEV